MKTIYKQLYRHIKTFKDNRIFITDSFVSSMNDADRPGFDWPVNVTENGCDYERQFFSEVLIRTKKDDFVMVREGEIIFKLLSKPSMNMERFLVMNKNSEFSIVFHDIEDDQWSRQPVFFTIPDEEFLNTMKFTSIQESKVTVLGKTYRLFSFVACIGTPREQKVVAAEAALDKLIRKCIETEQYHKVQKFDEMYGYVLPKEVNLRSDIEIRDSIEEIID